MKTKSSGDDLGDFSFSAVSLVLPLSLAVVWTKWRQMGRQMGGAHAAMACFLGIDAN